MTEESIQLVVAKAWMESQYYGLVISNKALYLVDQGKWGTVWIRGDPLLSGISLAIGAAKLYKAAKKGERNPEAIQNLSLEEVHHQREHTFSFSAIERGRVKKSFGEGTIAFRIPTGKKLIKYWDKRIGIPTENLQAVAAVLNQYGFSAE